MHKPCRTSERSTSCLVVASILTVSCRLLGLHGPTATDPRTSNGSRCNNDGGRQAEGGGKARGERLALLVIGIRPKEWRATQIDQ
jgi:hypothetical protein